MSARPLRVLFVSPWFHPAVRYGGPIYAQWNLARALGERGVEVRVLSTDADGEHRLNVLRDREHVRAANVRVTYVARLRDGAAFASPFPRRLSERVAWADVVHLGSVYDATTFPTLLAVRGAQKPLVWTPFGAHYYAERLPGVRRPHLKRAWDSLARALLDRSRTTMIAASQMEAEATRARMPGVSIEVVREPVVLPTLEARPALEGPLRVLFLARLHPIKRLERLLDALRDHTATLTIAGAGEPSYVASLRARASPLGERARFVGHIVEGDKAALFASHDLLVLPSHRESYGIVVGEALAHGVPALVVRPTAWERLAEEGAGLVVGPSELAATLRTLDRASLAALGAQARRYAERTLSIDHAAERMIGIYEGMHGPGRASVGRR
ncbi:MAG: glycosyltransferase [Deltaproteobacteria bacterium]|nr:glycosyltransferase [Deltaproteobacteria bacterium]